MKIEKPLVILRWQEQSMEKFLHIMTNTLNYQKIMIKLICN